MFNYSTTLALALALATAVQADEPADTAARSFHLVFVGDTGHGESYQLIREAEGQPNVLKDSGYDAPLAKLKPLLEGSDYVIANLETPVIDEAAAVDVPYPEKDYSHWTDGRFAPSALRRVGIDAVSLANNHTMDYAEEGLKQSLDHLRRAGLVPFGAGMNADEARRTVSVPLPQGAAWPSVEIIGLFEYRSSYDKKYSFYARPDKPGANPIEMDSLRDQIAALKSVDRPPFVVLFPHWGENYVWRSGEQATLADEMVLAGADLVIGHGSHMVQELEVIRWRPVLFSLGNFSFLSNGRYSKLNAPPFSYVLWLSIPNGTESSSRLEIRLYPIVTDNQVTKFVSRPVDEQEFGQLRDVLKSKGQDLEADRDDRGFYFRVDFSA